MTDQIIVLQAYRLASAAALDVLRGYAAANPHIKELQDSVRREQEIHDNYYTDEQSAIRRHKKAQGEEYPDATFTPTAHARAMRRRGFVPDPEKTDCAYCTRVRNEYYEELERRSSSGVHHGWRAPDYPDDCKDCGEVVV